MSAGVIGLVFCVVSFILVLLSNVVPYWLYVTASGIAGYNNGLWLTCLNVVVLSGSYSCSFIEFGNNDIFDAARGLEAAGCVVCLIAMIAASVAVCCAKTSTNYVIAAVLALLGAALVITGFIMYAVEMSDVLKYAHAGFYLNIFGGVGSGIGGVCLLLARDNSVSHMV